MTDFSSDMTWFNEDYFDFGPEDAPNTDRWAEWTVEVVYPGKYIVSEIGYCENGHSYLLELKDGEKVVSSFEALDEDHWGEGDQSYTQYEMWDLNEVTPNVYTLHVKNNTEWGQPKLKSLTLEYNGEIPTGAENGEWMNGEKAKEYDILGRPVDASYKGIVVMRGKKIIR